MTTSVGIVGFRGYSGAEFVRILGRHSHVEPVLIEHRSDSAAEILPRGWKRHKTIACTPRRLWRPRSCRRVPCDAARSVDGVDSLVCSMRARRSSTLSGAFRLRTPENIPALVQNRSHAARTAQPRRHTDYRSSVANRIRARASCPIRAATRPRPTSRSNRSSTNRFDRQVRRHRLRCQIGRERRWTQAIDEDELLRGDGKFLRVFDARSPARAGSAHELRAGRARLQLCRAAYTHRSRHSRDDLFPRSRRAHGRI